MRYYLGPRITGKGEESSWLLAPDGSAGLIDLRSAEERANGVNGLCLIASPIALNSDYRLLHNGDIRDAVMQERDRAVWSSALRIGRVSGTTLAEWLYDTLTLQSDPTGEGIGPLMPARDGMEIHLDGLVMRRRFDPKSPEARAVIDLRRRQYREIRATYKDIDPTLHRRLLTDWGQKLGIDRPEDVFIPSDLPKESPLPRHTFISDAANRADADALGSSVEGWSWTEVLNDIDLVSSGAFQGQGSTLNTIARAETDLSSDDHASRIILNFIHTTGGTSGPLARMASSGGSCYWFGVRVDAPRQRLFTLTVNTASATQIGSTVTDALPSRPYIMVLTCDGSTITGYQNTGFGTLTSKITTTDTAITGNTRTGMLLASSGTNLSSARVFRAYDIPPDSAENLGTELLADGIWTWFNHPRAIYYGGNYYFGTVSSTGDVEVSKRASDGTITTFTLSTALEVDDHNDCALLVLASGKLACAYSKHGADSTWRYRISTNALPDISAFDSEGTVTISSTHTYANLFDLSTATNRYLNISRRINGTTREWGYIESADFSTWSGFTSIWAGAGTDTPYLVFRQNGQKIHVACTDKHPVNGQSSVYHFYIDVVSGALKFYNSAGTEDATMPLSTSTATLVSDGSSIRRWIFDVTVDGSGYPWILGSRYPRNSGLDIRYMLWRWNGSAWSEVEITEVGQGIYTPEIYYSGLACFDSQDNEVIYLSRRIGEIWEIQKWTTADAGATWTKDSTVTKGSTVHNIRPVSPKDHDGTLPVLWVRENSAGSYVSYASYDTAIHGLVVSSTPGGIVRQMFQQGLYAGYGMST